MSSQNLPEVAKPRVFHHEGRRLFLIDGVPRVADEDLAKDLQMARKRSIRWNLIDANRDKLLLLGTILQIDPGSREFVAHDLGDVPQLPFDKAVAEMVLELLKAEGLIDPSKRGEKPKINFLNAEQAKFLIVAFGMPRGRDLLVDLLKLEKAWLDGTLEPARPQVEAPKTEALPPPADPAPSYDRLAILHHGVVYQVDDDELKVVSTFLWRPDDWQRDALIEEHRDALQSFGAMPIADGGQGLLLNRFQLELLGSLAERDDRLFASVLETLRAHADGHMRIDGNRLADVMPPDEVSRAYAAARWPGTSAPGWGAVPFLRDAGSRLRVRHGRLAYWLGVGERKVLEAVARFRREIEVHGMMERFEVDAKGIETLGVYLTEVQASVLVEAMGLGTPEGVNALFEDRIAFEVDFEMRAARDAMDHEARVAAAKARPTSEGRSSA